MKLGVLLVSVKTTFGIKSEASGVKVTETKNRKLFMVNYLVRNEILL
jgi:hypothetical protein